MRAPRRVVAIVGLLGVLVAACSSGGDGASTTSAGVGTTADAPTSSTVVDPCRPRAGDGCTLRLAADASGTLVGTAVVSSRLVDEPDYAEVVAREFSSVTPENDLKWAATQPARGEFTFDAADATVDFAVEHGIEVKGHTLVWDQASIDSMPDWVVAIDDPEELRAVLDEHITTVVGRYAGRVDRWDVVNEPLETAGVELYENHFAQVLGPDYLDVAFELAHAADPEATLFLNEHSLEYVPGRVDALEALVQGMLDRGVPIDGIGLQAHLITGPPAPGTIIGIVERFEALGLEVAITELDVPVAAAADDRLEAQAATYRQVVEECLAAGCREVTMWGFTDRYTWIDGFIAPGLSPLVLDEDYQPKPAYLAVREVLLDAAG